MYQVLKMRVDIELTLVSGLELHGAMFISENLVSYTGKPRLEDFLSQGDRLLPLIGADKTLLVNKDRIIFLKSSEDDLQFLLENLRLQPRKVELVLSEGHSIMGSIYSNLPPELLRVSDYFNQRETFLPIYCDQQKLIINTHHIIYVNDGTL